MYIEKQREIPITYNVDVLVLGGGPAGFAAAVNAARQGADTLLVEQSGDIGGVATTGLMSHWTGDTKGGFYEEILERSNEDMRCTINPERLKTLMQEMLYEAGAGILLYTFACEAITEGNTLKGVIIENKSGRQAIMAKVVVDATGDGDIAAKAGASFTKGRESDGKMQPMTLMFKVAGVSESASVFPGCFEDNIPVPAGSVQDLGKAELPSPAGHVLLYRSTLPGVVTVNMTNCIDVDGTRAEDLTKASFVCRKQMDEIVVFLRKYLPGFEDCFVISSASIVGVRETRHFHGRYTLTEQDILQARQFDDRIVENVHFNFDVHSLTGAGLDETGAQKQFTQNKGYSIPYGCFLPKETDGLLFCGRNISGTHMAHSNYRVMPICVNMGQGVGIAAALAAKSGRKVSEIKPSEIRDRL